MHSAFHSVCVKSYRTKVKKMLGEVVAQSKEDNFFLSSLLFGYYSDAMS